MGAKNTTKLKQQRSIKPLSGVNHNQGFTLIELIMVITISGILLTVAVPSFNLTIKNTRLDSHASRFISDLSFARSEAIKRGERVTICKSNNKTNCTNSDGWEEGWIVFVDDINENAQVQPGEVILRVKDPLDGSTVMVTTNNVNNYISYVQDGFSRRIGGAVQVGSIAICDDRNDDSKGKAIRINPTGSAIMSDVAASPLTCVEDES